MLGAAWTEVHPAVRRAHLDGEVLRLVGCFHIRRGTGRLARCLLSIVRLPPAAESLATELIVTPLGHGEQWTRQFGDRAWVTTQSERADGILAERMSVLEFRFRLQVSGGTLIYRQVGAALRWGPLSMPLPRWLSPRVEAREEAYSPEEARVSVAVTAPIAGFLIAYEGLMRPKELE